MAAAASGRCHVRARTSGLGQAVNRGSRRLAAVNQTGRSDDVTAYSQTPYKRGSGRGRPGATLGAIPANDIPLSRMNLNAGAALSRPRGLI